VAERIRHSVEAHTFTVDDGQTFRVTISIGVATYNPQASTVTEKMPGGVLVGHADRALYAAKSAGRNKVISVGEIGLDKQQWF
jgi:diguanylate cyclase (GGDEF)-like protein